jgi:hypothetical protein
MPLKVPDSLCDDVPHKQRHAHGDERQDLPESTSFKCHHCVKLIWPAHQLSPPIRYSLNQVSILKMSCSLSNYSYTYIGEIDILAQSITPTLTPSQPQSLLHLQELLEFSKHDISKTLLSHDELSPILSNPLRIQKILILTHEQFFLGLEEKHETNQCVNDAVDCLWAYFQQLLSPGLPSAGRNKHVKSYVRALSSIRSALDAGSALDSIDVWYATLILILYEVRFQCLFRIGMMLTIFLVP